VRDRVDGVMKKTHVTDVASRHCAKLSKGYKQRVGLAQALIHNPDVLVLDEPTAGLDPKQIIDARQLIKELGGSHTVVLSTHILSEVSQTCHRVVIISKGKVVAEDTPENLTTRLHGGETMHLQVHAPGVDVGPILSAVPGVTRVTTEAGDNGLISVDVDSEQGRDVRRELAALVVNSGWGLLELRPMRMSLEDVFLKLASEDEGDVAATPEPAAPEPAAPAQEDAHA
jgi:ABC-2 type transport system ATP-binding protein